MRICRRVRSPTRPASLVYGHLRLVDIDIPSHASVRRTRPGTRQQPLDEGAVPRADRSPGSPVVSHLVTQVFCPLTCKFHRQRSDAVRLVQGAATRRAAAWRLTVAPPDYKDVFSLNPMAGARSVKAQISRRPAPMDQWRSRWSIKHPSGELNGTH